MVTVWRPKGNDAMKVNADAVKPNDFLWNVGSIRCVFVSFSVWSLKFLSKRMFFCWKDFVLVGSDRNFCHVHIRDVQSHSALDGHWCSPGFRCCSLFCSLEHRTRAGTYGETGLWYHLKTGSLVDAIAYISLKDRLVSWKAKHQLHSEEMNGIQIQRSFGGACLGDSISFCKKWNPPNFQCVILLVIFLLEHLMFYT